MSSDKDSDANAMGALKERMKTTWMAGDFGQVARFREPGAAETGSTNSFGGSRANTRRSSSHSSTVLAYGLASGTVMGDLMSCISSGDTGPLFVFCAARTSHIPFWFSTSMVIMPVRGGRTEPSTLLSP